MGSLASVPWLGWSGIALVLLGLSLRVWANRTLGQFYTRTLRVNESQKIVQQGPYRLIRHPGYVGVIALWIGAGLATTNWIAAAVITLMMLAVYDYRIRSEEAMLEAAFGEEYCQYAAHTWKLVPLVY